MGIGTKIAILMFTITVVLLFTGQAFPNLQFNTTSLPYTYAIFNLSYTPSDQANNVSLGYFALSNSSPMSLSGATNTTATTPLFGFFNPVSIVMDIISTLLGIFFAPVTTLINFGAPSILVALVGGVWVIMYILVIMMFVRGWDF